MSEHLHWRVSGHPCIICGACGDDEKGLTYRLDLTAPGTVIDCLSTPCNEHYVVRNRQGSWVKVFHNEKDAQDFGARHNYDCERLDGDA